MLLRVIYHGQQGNGTSGAQRPLSCGCNFVALDDVHRPPAEDMIDDKGDKSDDDAEKWCSNPRSFLATKTGFQKFRMKHPRRIIRQQPYLEVIRNNTLGLFAGYEQSNVPDETVGGYISITLEGGRMGDNLECFGEVLGLFVVFCLYYDYISHMHA